VIAVIAVMEHLIRLTKLMRLMRLMRLVMVVWLVLLGVQYPNHNLGFEHGVVWEMALINRLDQSY
jgi:hypothetical protein